MKFREEKEDHIMRITTQMLNASMRKAGLPVNNVSLLNCINSAGSSPNSLLSALNKKGIHTENKSYEKLKGQAEQLQQSAEEMASEKLFEEARKSGDLQSVYEKAQDLIKDYNSTVKSMKNTSSPLNQGYRQMMKEAYTDSKDALEEIGITMGNDGTLKIDGDKFKASDVDKLEKALCADGSFSNKLSFLAGRVADNAKANISSASSQYDILGNNYFAAASKYDFWG